MILQSLHQLYERLLTEPDSGISPPGYGKAKVSFALVLSKDGELLNVVPLGTRKGRRLVFKDMEVPHHPGRQGTKAPAYFMCDNAGYVLGIDAKGKRERSGKTFAAFRSLHQAVMGDSRDEGLLAVSRFLDKWDPSQAAWQEKIYPHCEDLVAGGNLVFRVDGERDYVHQQAAARQQWERHCQSQSTKAIGQCLVTGNRLPIADVHPVIRGVRDAQTTGAALVSFNKQSFCSYGKDQSFNAPVSQSAAFAYTTALNHLLARKEQKLQIGDATTVFWADRSSPVESLLEAFFNPPHELTESDLAKGGRPRYDAKTTQLIHDILERARDAKPIAGLAGWLDPDLRCFILGLSPNNARLAVRFWHVATLNCLARHIGRHYSDLAIERQYASDPEFIPIWRILTELSPLWDIANLPKTIASSLIRSMVIGSNYPTVLKGMLISRIRADHTITYVRAALVKACLLRAARGQGKTLPEASMTLNAESLNQGYRLGRLFAALEKAQQDANGDELNGTIRDRYFASALATPATVFPVLMRQAHHHIANGQNGGNSDKRIEEILAGVTHFPQRLSLDDQGLFVLGYYHQRNAFYRKDEDNGKRSDV